MKPIVLTIAGSDSSAGAGVQADLKTISVLGCYAVTAFTCLTAQNPLKVTDIVPVDAKFLKLQLDTLMSYFYIKTIKIGVISSIEQVQVIQEFIQKHKIENVILDPVLVSQSGYPLSDSKTTSEIKERLLPIALLVTPNIPEAEILSSMKIGKKEDFIKVGMEIIKDGAQNVLVKGGHLINHKKASDLLIQKNGKQLWLENDFIKTKNNHGTGCILSSAIASHLALGYDLEYSVKLSNKYVYELLRKTPKIKQKEGEIGLLDHF